MFSFLFGLGVGTVCLLNRDATRRLLATVIAKGQDATQAAGREGLRWAATVREELEDIVAEARAQVQEEKEREG
jgi:hypothetical protein